MSGTHVRIDLDIDRMISEAAELMPESHRDLHASPTVLKPLFRAFIRLGKKHGWPELIAAMDSFEKVFLAQARGKKPKGTIQ